MHRSFVVFPKAHNTAAFMAQALAKCNDISPWLSTHLGDLLDKIGALDSDGADARDAADASLTGASASTQRDWYLLRWADQLQGDEGVWRIALHYLAFVAASKNLALAEVAEGRMKAVLKHTKWRDPTVPYASASAKADVQMDSLANGEIENQHFEKGEPGQEQETTVEDVLKACYEYGFDDVATDLCKVNQPSRCLLSCAHADQGFLSIGGFGKVHRSPRVWPGCGICCSSGRRPAHRLHHRNAHRRVHSTWCASVLERALGRMRH